jgi:ribosome-binding ATPase
VRTGILGHPQSGKTTLFNVLARSHAPTGMAASTAGGIQLGTVQVPDSRLAALRDLFQPKKYTPARIEYVDLAGQPAKGALLPQQITTADLLLLVVRAFDNLAVPHPKGSVDPLRDLAELKDELLLKDLAVLESRLTKVRKTAQIGQKESKEELPILEKCAAALESGKALRDLTFSADEDRRLRGYQLLTEKPLLTVFNVNEDAVQGAGLADKVAPAPHTAALEISGKVEMDLVDLEETEAKEFMQVLGIQESGLDRVIHTSYALLGLRSFFTVGEDEVRAWTITEGTPAVRAAGKIHSDLERGFIRAEVVSSRDLLASGGLHEAKAKNLLRVEGKDYVVQDGDVLNIRFSV